MKLLGLKRGFLHYKVPLWPQKNGLNWPKTPKITPQNITFRPLCKGNRQLLHIPVNAQMKFGLNTAKLVTIRHDLSSYRIFLASWPLSRRFWLYDKVCTLVLVRERLSRVRKTFLQYLGTVWDLASNPTEIERMFARRSFSSTKRSQSLLGCGLPTFHVVFQESNTHKKREIGGNIAVNLGICQHF